MHTLPLCPKCKFPRLGNHGYCQPCRTEYNRNWWQAHKATPEERLKANTRAIANIKRKKGKLLEKACQSCGTEIRVEMHHEDYNWPLRVEWYCMPCHRAYHKQERAEARKARFREIAYRQPS